MLLQNVTFNHKMVQEQERWPPFEPYLPWKARELYHLRYFNSQWLNQKLRKLRDRNTGSTSTHWHKCKQVAKCAIHWEYCTFRAHWLGDITAHQCDDMCRSGEVHKRLLGWQPKFHRPPTMSGVCNNYLYYMCISTRPQLMPEHKIVVSADRAHRLHGPNGVTQLGELRKYKHYVNASWCYIMCMLPMSALLCEPH